MSDKIIRVVELSPEARKSLWIATSVKDGQPVDPPLIEYPSKLAIAFTKDGFLEGENYVLYFLADNFRVLDFSANSSLQEAFQQVGGVVAVQDWTECDIDRRDDDGDNLWPRPLFV